MTIRILFCLFLSIVLVSCDKINKKEISKKPNFKSENNFTRKIDSVKNSKCESIIYGKTISNEGNKYSIWKIKVIEIVKNNSNSKIYDTIKVAHHSWKNSNLKKGMKCIFYLNPWDLKNGYWFILNKETLYGCDCD